MLKKNTSEFNGNSLEKKKKKKPNTIYMCLKNEQKSPKGPIIIIKKNICLWLAGATKSIQTVLLN